ncbi:glutamate 5-kinase [Campylobacter sp. 19-13652]|uniref:glutamate 5-kinase n=1 Tax=Campylobacter sp. 19-13652 TaxID=2840180 RepID=UPI0021A772BC|nr:glutamate 5-kinase [Campylobacter sp. 19-13652]
MKAQNIIIKVGTSTLTKANGELNHARIKSIVSQIAQLTRSGFRVLLVSSGAVGAGMGAMGLDKKPADLASKQALAAVGQVALMGLYERLFWAYDIKIAQLLLTKDDFANRARFLSAREVCTRLLEAGVIPIVNENDPVVHDELKVGDNDTLSALVAGLVDASALIILSDIDGLYDKNPIKFKDAKLIPEIDAITEQVRAMAGGAGSELGTGGMATKINAAAMATSYGVDLIIVNGASENILIKAANGERVGSRFRANKKRINLKKYWLSYAGAPKGSLEIDAGAQQALVRGGSLLAVGVRGVSGEFKRGDLVKITKSGEVLGSGLVAYDSDECAIIAGAKGSEIEGLLGYKFDDFIIHANNLSLSKKEEA